MARPSLVYVTSRFPFGSSETFLIPEIRELQRTFDVGVVPMHPDGAVRHEDAAQMLSITTAVGLVSPRVLLAALFEAARHPRRAARVLAAIVRGSRCVRILLRNLFVLPKGLWLARESRRRAATHIHAQWASASATMAYVAGEVSGVPWSLTAHRWDIAEDNLLREKAQSAQFFRAISARGAQALARISGADPQNVVVVHLGVALPSARAARSSRTTLRVIVAANLKDVKGHRYLLEAIGLLRRRRIDVHLDVAGAGPLRAELEAQVDALDIRPAVSFLGLVSHASLLRDLQDGRWDVMALPSILTPAGDEEGIPVALMEAMACGIPVVATQTGGIPELVVPGTGILVPDKSGPALADALQQLHDEPRLRVELGGRAAEWVRASFDAGATGRTLSELIASHIRAGR